MGRVVRFVVVGLVNTAFGYALFLGFYLLVGLSAPASNGLSYLIAILLAFFLYRRFVFQASHPQSGREAIVYLVSAAVAFSLNLIVLIVLTSLGMYAPVAQIGAMITYTACFYLLNRFVVFKVSVKK